jgi:hypothetical protein
VNEKPPVERRWRNATLLFLGIFIVCAIVALILVRALPSNTEWAGIEVPTVIATLGSLAGGIGVLCAARLITLRLLSGDDD